MITKINGISLNFDSKIVSQTVTGTTTAFMDSIFVRANTLLTSGKRDFINVRFTPDITITSGSPVFNYFLYWNTTPSVSGGIQLATQQTIAGSTGISFQRHILVKSSTEFYIMDPTFSAANDIGDFATTVVVVGGLNLAADGYFVYGANRVAGLTNGTTTGYKFIIEI